MDSNISLINQSPKKSPSRYSHAYPSFFSTHTTSPLFHNRLALVHKIGEFIEEAIDTCYFEYWLSDMLNTPFCRNETQQPKVNIVPFILRMIEIMDENCAIDAILICMVIYIDRYFNLHKNDWLHGDNVERLLMYSAWLAAKTLEDTPLDCTPWAALSGHSKQQFKTLECYFLDELTWNTHISEAVYQNFCHALSTYQPQLDYQTMHEDELRGLAFI
ncbi:MAG: hypothetical protein P1U39_02115 [Legionellaceae bacterium]|nr:hypothetical protein [Legionellaceae bacterium]